MRKKNYSTLLFYALFMVNSLSAQNTFTVSSGTNVVTSGNVTIDYKGGTLNNNGTIANTAGTLAFSAPVTFAGTGTTTTNSLKIEHAGTSLLNNRINLSGVVEVNNGNLNANNNLTLLSNASGSAVIAPVASGSTISGKVTVERFIPLGKRAFRFLTPGVTTDNFISNNWQLGTHITGSTTGANGFDATLTGNPSLYTYNNQVSSGTGWTPIASTTGTNLNAGQGYRILIRGDRNVNINAASAANMNNAVTLNATGSLLTGSILFNSSSAVSVNDTTNPTTNGYTLIGNPYVNTVNWNTLSKVGLTDAYYTWDANLGTAEQRGRYVVYSTTTGSSNILSDVNQYIQPGQAFLIKNSVLGVSGQLQFTESDKANGSVISKIADAKATPKARLDLQVFENKTITPDAYPMDVAVTVFGTMFTNDTDAGDVAKLSTGAENIAFLNKNASLTIDARPIVTDTDEVLIQLQEFKAAKEYSFRTQFSGFEADTKAYLADTFLNKYTPLEVQTPTDVAFATTNDVASYAPDRFKIIFQNKTLSNETFNVEQVTLYPNPVTNNQFNITLPAVLKGEVRIQLINVVGQTVYETKTDAKQMLTISLDKVLPAGIYLVQITNQDQSITKKITIN
ncbi:T9SS type A sorting domain-containing protein [Flavobacterium eburneipallidum]|uniref:T9SS type A sorting domain-containing protein n=1 Tax=Flavobacterium eburneipallidum TaxID=3003263 RepID=UPI0024821933|nr:T9SS type A sorting domain-containing protein [Flavobacterium eburneipallidum]